MDDEDKLKELEEYPGNPDAVTAAPEVPKDVSNDQPAVIIPGDEKSPIEPRLEPEAADPVLQAMQKLGINTEALKGANAAPAKDVNVPGNPKMDYETAARAYLQNFSKPPDHPVLGTLGAVLPEGIIGNIIRSKLAREQQGKQYALANLGIMKNIDELKNKSLTEQNAAQRNATYAARTAQLLQAAADKKRQFDFDHPESLKDPNSPANKAYRQAVSKIMAKSGYGSGDMQGMEGLTAPELEATYGKSPGEKLFVQGQASQRAANTASRAEENADRADQKIFNAQHTKFLNDANTNKGANTPLGKSQNLLNVMQRSKVLLTNPDGTEKTADQLNALDPRETTELASTMASIFTPGGRIPIETLQAFTPNTKGKTWAEIKEWYLGHPEGAEQGAFAKKFLYTINREEKSIKGQLFDAQRQAISHLQPVWDTANDQQKEVMYRSLHRVFGWDRKRSDQEMSGNFSNETESAPSQVTTPQSPKNTVNESDFKAMTKEARKAFMSKGGKVKTADGRLL